MHTSKPDYTSPKLDYSPKANYGPSGVPRDRSIENLSRDLD